MIEYNLKYKESGIECVPCKKDKSPYYQKSWKEPFEDGDFLGVPSIGLKCGAVSGGLECLDFDNHSNDAKQILTSYLSTPEIKAIYEKYKLPIESTQNGGYHLLFRCSKNEGNRKLAQRKLDNGQIDTFIETRGEGGYFVAYPSENYKVVRNDIFNIQTITEFERAVLIDIAASFNEYIPTIKTEYESTDRPGDIYNNSSYSIDEMRTILEGAGWQKVTNYGYRRPGKSEGISATLGKVASNVFFVFSSNCSPFEPMKGYTPFQVLGLLKYNGDFKQAAESLPKPEKITTYTKQILNDSEIEKIIDEIQIDTKKEIEKPPVILFIKQRKMTNFGDVRLFSLNNFSVIIGKAKSKKTYCLSLFTSGILSGNTNFFKADIPENKKVVLWFDTEQGAWDSQNVIKRIEKMSNFDSNFHAYNLRKFNPLERCTIIEYIFKQYNDKIAFCVIDGIADLANAINDELEATRIATMLLRLTAVYNCHISTVLHQNKNDNYATGHIGSAVMKKAENIISVLKDPQDKRRSIVRNDLGRGIEFDEFSFYVNEDGIPIIETDEKAPLKSYYDNDEKDDCPF